MTYGLNIESHKDKYLQATERASDHAVQALVPGAFLVDTIPKRRSEFSAFWHLVDTGSEVRYVPEWFPGAGFKAFAKVGRELFDVAIDGPLAYAKESLKVHLQHPRSTALIFALTMAISRTGATHL